MKGLDSFRLWYFWAVGLFFSLLLFLFWQDGLGQELHVAKKKELELKYFYINTQRRAVSLGAYKKLLEQLKASEADLLRRLPEIVEPDALLRRLENTAEAAGVDLLQIEQGNIRKQEFYTLLPLKVIASGKYAALVNFVYEVNKADTPLVQSQGFVLEKQADDRLELQLSMSTYGSR